MSVKDKVAIVTGGGTGLGAAVSTRLAAEGARVDLADRDPLPLAQPDQLLRD